MYVQYMKAPACVLSVVFVFVYCELGAAAWELGAGRMELTAHSCSGERRSGYKKIKTKTRSLEVKAR